MLHSHHHIYRFGEKVDEVSRMPSNFQYNTTLIECDVPVHHLAQLLTRRTGQLSEVYRFACSGTLMVWWNGVAV